MVHFNKEINANVYRHRLDFRRLPGPVFDPPRRESAGSFSRTAAGNRA